MAHKTLIGSTAYEVSGGKTLIGSTAYEISGGKTLVGGTGYDISFKPEPLEIFNPTNAFVNGFSIADAYYDSYGYSVANIGTDSNYNRMLYFYDGSLAINATLDIRLPASVTAGYTKLYWTGNAYQNNPSGGAGTNAKYGIGKCDQAKNGNWYNPAHALYYYSGSESYGTTWVGGLKTGVSLTSTTYSLDISSVAGQDYVYFAMYAPGGYSGYTTFLRIDKMWLE